MTVAFVAVALVATALTTAIALRTTERLFMNFLTGYRQARAQQLVPVLASWYAANGSWEGLRITAVPAMGMFRRGGIERVLVVDTSGRVVADTHEGGLPSPLPERWLRQGAPIVVGHQTVGTVLVVGAVEAGLLSLENRFTESVRRTTAAGGLAAAAVAGLLGLFLSQRLSRRLAGLREASARIARRDLSARVAEEGDDELAALARTFNLMARNLAESEKVRQNLVADVAHELRTPLSILRGNLESLQDGIIEATPEVISSLADEALRMSRLVNDLQVLGLAEAGQLPLVREAVAPADLVEGAVGALGVEARSRGIELVTLVPPGVPAVVADPGRSRQVLMNLLTNALRYTPPGGRVTVGATGDGDYVRFEVTDTGPGIAASDLPYIFDRFYRGDRARSRTEGGTGLGLAIARGLVEAQGGTIGVTSQPGGGASFVFTLPRSFPPT